MVRSAFLLKMIFVGKIVLQKASYGISSLVSTVSINAQRIELLQETVGARNKYFIRSSEIFMVLSERPL